MKTHSGAKRRFSITGSGKILRRKIGVNNFRRKKRGQTLREFGRHAASIRTHREAASPPDALLQVAGRTYDATNKGRGRNTPPTQEDHQAGEGSPRAPPQDIPPGERVGHARAAVRLRAPPRQEGRLPPPLDHAHQRRRAPARPELLAPDRRACRRPASRWTARCWPTSPCATTPRSARSRRRPRPRSGHSCQLSAVSVQPTPPRLCPAQPFDLAAHAEGQPEEIIGCGQAAPVCRRGYARISS